MVWNTNQLSFTDQKKRGNSLKISKCVTVGYVNVDPAICKKQLKSMHWLFGWADEKNGIFEEQLNNVIIIEDVAHFWNYWENFGVGAFSYLKW